MLSNHTCAWQRPQLLEAHNQVQDSLHVLDQANKNYMTQHASRKTTTSLIS